MITPVLGRPGIGPSRTASHGFVSRDGQLSYLPVGGVIDGTKTRDVANSDNQRYLRAGLLMGKVTSGGKWANSFIGATQAAYTSGGTSLSLTPAAAVELVRRVGSSGTFVLIGPATAAGANNSTTVTYSSVNTGTGAVTITDIGANRIAGCLVGQGDGSAVPRSFIPDGLGELIPDATPFDTNFPRIPIGGIIQPDRLIDWPTDTTLRTYIRESLSTLSGGKFTFSDQY
jgi:hypothetical protein